MLTKSDLNAIGKIVDKKINTTLDKKLDTKLKPIHTDIKKIKKDIKVIVNFFLGIEPDPAVI